MNKEVDGTKSTIVDVSVKKITKRKRIKIKELVYSTDEGGSNKKQ